MMSNKETELTTAIMLYAMRCLAEGDQSALRNMNFGPREVEALREMSLGDLCHIEALRAHCLKVALDRKVYWPLVANLRKRRESEELQKELISADAGHEMMKILYGMSGREYAHLRRMLVVETIAGRPPDPSEEDLQLLWEVWKVCVEDREDKQLQPDEYLAVHKETGIPLRAVWSQTSRWVEYGQLAQAREVG